MLFGNLLKMSKADTILYSVVLILITVLMGFLIYNSTMTKKENFGDFTEENKFAMGQRDTFWHKMNTGLSFSPQLENDLKGASGIFNTSTPFSKNKTTDEAPSFFQKSLIPGNRKAEKECSVVKEPRYLPPRDLVTNSGCGWWYMDAPEKDSIGAKGTSSGPFNSFLSNKHPGGRWVWDLQEAQMLEEAKKCKALTLCDHADIYPGECGFCVATNIGVPVDKYGKAKYPNQPNFACEDIVTKPSFCPKPEIGSTSSISEPVDGKYSSEFLISLARAVGCTDNGILITILSSGDYDKFLKGTSDEAELFRLANDILMTDENIPLQMEFYGKGSCEKAEASKYYRNLRRVALSGKTESSRAAANYITRGIVFDPCLYSEKQKGPFSLLCLKRIALENNCQPDGTDFPSTTPYKTKNIPKICGKFGRPNSDGSLRLYTEGECDTLQGVYSGNGECLNKEGGSFSSMCRMVNELDSPPMPTKPKYDKMEWGQINTYFQKLYSSMNSQIKHVQADATKRCLGIDITETTPECDDKVGCEVLWYTWDYDYKMPDSKVAKGTFLGRTIQNTLPKFNVNTRDGSYNPFNIIDNVAFHVRTIYSTKKADNKKFGILSTDGVCVKLDDQPILKKWLPGSQQSLETSIFTMDSIKPRKLDIFWFKDHDRATFSQRVSENRAFSEYRDIAPYDLSLHVPSNYPLVRWDFYNSILDDRNYVLRSSSNDLEFGNKDGKKCILLNKQNSSLSINNNIRGTAFKSFTYKVYVDSVPNYWSRLFSFRNGPTNCDPSDTHGNSITIEGGLCADGSIWMGAKTKAGPFYVWSKTEVATFPMNKWFHVSFVYDDDFKGSSIYFNGEIVKRTRDERCPADVFQNTTYDSISIGLGHYAKECNQQPIYCGIAWAHWFDYTLDKNGVRKDLTTAFTNKKIYDEMANTGWKF